MQNGLQNVYSTQKFVKKPSAKGKQYIPYCNHIRFADRGWEETVDTLEIVGAILHFFKSSKTFRANEVQKINFFLQMQSNQPISFYSLDFVHGFPLSRAGFLDSDFAFFKALIRRLGLTNSIPYCFLFYKLKNQLTFFARQTLCKTASIMIRIIILICFTACINMP